MDLRNRGSKRNNPFSQEITFKGDRGVFRCYDRSKKENTEVEEVQIMIVAIKACINGWSKSKEQGIYSNLIEPFESEKLFVKCGKEIIEEGLYQDIKESVIRKGGAYHKTLIGMMRGESGAPLLVRVDLKGKALQYWNNFSDEVGESNLPDSWLSLGKGEFLTNGNVEYFVPSFALVDASKEDYKDSFALFNKVLIPYLNNNKPSENTEIEEERHVESKPLEEETSGFPKGNTDAVPF